MDLPRVFFKPVDAAGLDLLAGWFAPPAVHHWFDFGHGCQQISRASLQALVGSRRNWARLFCGEDGRAVGYMNLSGVDNLMGTAEISGLRGDFAPGPRNLTGAAFLATLATGFYDFDRALIATWVVASNRPSLAVHRRTGMVEVGRQRQRHVINGERLDRICFDMTREEFCARHQHVLSDGGLCAASWQARRAGLSFHLPNGDSP